VPEVAAPPSPLALLRFVRGFSQVETARQAGISEGTVRRIEKGGTPQWRTAVAIAAAMNVDASTLFPANVCTYNGDDPASNRVDAHDAQEVRDADAINPTD